MKRPPARLSPEFAFVALTLVLLVFMAVAMHRSAAQESITWDEAGHIPHGYGYLATGNFWFDQVHPALPRLLAGLPLLAVEPRVATEHPSWRRYDFLGYRQLFLFGNRLKPDTLVSLARLPTMLCTLLLALALVLWTRRRFGTAAGAIAVSLFALDPNILAYGRYATTEILTATAFFLTFICWGAHLESRRVRYLVAAGVFTGVALATKTSMLFLFGLLPLLYLIRWWQRPDQHSLPRLVASMLVVGMVSVAVVGAVYWPVTWELIRQGGQPMADHVDPSTPVGRTFQKLAVTFHLPLHPYLMSYYWIAKTNEHGTPGYLLGEVSNLGWWYYYPVALLVKSTTAFLAGLFVALGAMAGWLARPRSLASLRSLPFCWYTVSIPPAVYFGLTFLTNINSGSRHLIPALPFLFCLIGAVLGHETHAPLLRRLRLATLSVLAVMLVTESAIAYPHYLAFFNLPSGGSDYGRHYLVDSSLDWGQDLKGLARYVEKENTGEICLAYFGMDSPEYRGIPNRPLQPSDSPESLDCIAAVSATYLAGMYLPGGGNYNWLHNREPVARIGHSIYLYDLRK